MGWRREILDMVVELTKRVDEMSESHTRQWKALYGRVERNRDSLTKMHESRLKNLEERMSLAEARAAWAEKQAWICPPNDAALPDSFKEGTVVRDDFGRAWLVCVTDSGARWLKPLLGED